MNDSQPHPAVYRSVQSRFLTIPQTPLSYWLRDRFFDLLAGPVLGDVAEVRQCPATARDLYAVFIERCLQLAADGGQVAMVTQQSWMFLRSFAELRKRLLEQQAINCLAHLGPHAFEEITGEVVNVVLFVLTRAVPLPEHRLWAARLIGPKSAREKDALLREAIQADQAVGRSERHEPGGSRQKQGTMVH